jgi:hypothetical protein
MSCAGYSGNPGASRVDTLYFIVGDTNGDSPYFSRTEVQFVADSNPDNCLAGAVLADMIANKLIGLGNVSIGRTRVDNLTRADQFRARAKELRDNGPCGTGLPGLNGGALGGMVSTGGTCPPLFRVGADVQPGVRFREVSGLDCSETCPED